MNDDKLWKLVLEDLQVSVSAGAFSSWISTLRLGGKTNVDDQRYIIDVHCSSAFHRTIIENRFYSQIKTAFDRVLGQQTELRLSIDTTLPLQNPSDFGADSLFAQTQTPTNQLSIQLHQLGLREDYNFENFAVSSSNEVAYAAAQAVADNLGSAYNPLFLHGDVGVGKTHLMQAIAIRALTQQPDLKIIYCPGEQFTNEIIEAIQQKTTPAFRQRYRRVKALFIDDIQFIAGKTTVQEEFFHTFNAINQVGGQVVLTSDRPPAEIKALEDRLRSRFEAGLIVDIGEPNFELRTAIVLIKTKQHQINLPMDTAQTIAANIQSARQIEGFLIRLKTESRLKNQHLTPGTIEALLHLKSTSNDAPPPLRPAEILRGVAHYYDLSTKDIKGISRTRRLVTPRHIAMYLMRVDYKLPLDEVGAYFSNRDHTTVMHAVHKISQQMKDQESLRLDVSAIREELYH